MVAVWEANVERGGLMAVAPPNYQDWRDQNTVFEDVVGFYTVDFTLVDEGVPERLEGARVSSGTFELLGVVPALGRGFLPAEEVRGENRVVVLSDGLWKRRFGAATDVLGTSVRIDGADHTVVGVMPPGFHYPPPMAFEGTAPSVNAELWAPLDITPNQGRGAHFMRVIGRLTPGFSLVQAEGEMVRLANGLAGQYPDTNRFWEVRLVPLDVQITGEVRSSLLLLLAAVGFVLLIACTNVANLILARELSRQKEIATRAALGAGRVRLARQLVTENLLLSLGGGILGFLIAYFGVDLLVAISPANIPRLDEVSVDLRIAVVALGISVATGLVFGLVPAVRMSSPNLFAWLRGRDSSEAGSNRLQSALVVGEVALSLVLLAGAGLLFQSFLNLRAIDPGFSSQDTMTFRLSLPEERYGERYQRVQFGQALLDRLSALQVVRSAGFADSIPLADDRQGTSLHIAGTPLPTPGEEAIVNFTLVSSGYFRAMGMQLVVGRSFDARDVAEGNPTVIIDRALATRYFPGEDPIGRRINVGFNSEYREVVGVVSDVKHETLAGGVTTNAYVPIVQVPWPLPLVYAIRVDAGVDLVNPVREVVRSMDPELPVYAVRYLNDVLSDSIATPRFSALLLGSFAVGALLLSAVGIYGVISFSVRRRIREIGIRVAMGAEPGDIFKLVIARGMGLAGIGVGIGLAGVLALTRFLSSQLFGVGSADPMTLGGITGLLLLTAFLACYLPARRATEIDPLTALHLE